MIPARRTDEADDESELSAGVFSSWLADVRAAIEGRAEATVPCGECSGCCTAGQFVHIGPDELDTLAHVPRELLFPAPGRPRGHVLMGYDEHGRCPMLVGGRCSIYAYRPATCRTYDCRVFAAAGVAPDEDDGRKAPVAARVRRWRFEHPDPGDRVGHEAVRAAARFVRAHREVLPDPAMAGDATRLAVLAVAIHDVFIGVDRATGEATVAEPKISEVHVQVGERLKVEGGPGSRGTPRARSR